MSKPRLFIITGISGSGKTTVARYLLGHGEVAFDSKINPGLYQFVDKAGTVAQSIKLHDEHWQKTYKWSLNREKLEELLEQNHDAARVFLCGKANLFQYWDKADGVFLLRINEATLLKRLNNESRDNLFAKDKETQSKLAENLDTVQNKILEKGAILVDAKSPVSAVVHQIIQAVDL
jgi:thymidylate kinase